jgi:steroid delta-isomerase-like uncharacterized protein
VEPSRTRGGVPHVRAALTPVADVDNKSVTRQFIHACVNGEELERLPEFVAGEVVVHQGTPCGTPDTRGLPELADVFRRIHRVFPDFHVTLDDLIAEGDQVAVRWTARGTHEAEWAGIPATGRRVAFGGIEIYRFEGGKIREWWRNEDFSYLVEQLAAPDA